MAITITAGNPLPRYRLRRGSRNSSSRYRSRKRWSASESIDLTIEVEKTARPAWDRRELGSCSEPWRSGRADARRSGIPRTSSAAGCRRHDAGSPFEIRPAARSPPAWGLGPGRTHCLELGDEDILRIGDPGEYLLRSSSLISCLANGSEPTRSASLPRFSSLRLSKIPQSMTNTSTRRSALHALCKRLDRIGPVQRGAVAHSLLKIAIQHQQVGSAHDSQKTTRQPHAAPPPTRCESAKRDRHHNLRNRPEKDHRDAHSLRLRSSKPSAAMQR